MNQDSDRRILTCAAVRPCPDVSPAALLRGLLDLCRSISRHNSAVFTVHKRFAAELLRQAGVLCLIFEEIRANLRRLQRIPDKAVECLSELYVLLQKLHCLVEDCAREGAHVWMLMNSDRVAGEFCLLVRSAAKALDALPLMFAVHDADVRELVELLRKQAWNVRTETDPTDAAAREDVLAALESFRNRVAPDSGRLKRVLNHLKIRSWSECNKEIRFLEQELCLEMEDQNGETELLCSLLGLMNYCRGAICHFKHEERRNNQILDDKSDAKWIDHVNLEDFRCPITLEPMVDPVTVSTGQTYDRVSITKWLNAGNVTCPKTGEKLSSTDLIPNLVLRNLIWRFYPQHQNVMVNRSNLRREMAQTQLAPSSPEATQAARMLAVFLVEKLSTGTSSERRKAAYEIRLLTKHNSLYRACLVEAGSISWLLNMLSSVPCNQDNSMAALLNLSKHCKGKTIIVELGGLSPILEVLIKGRMTEARENAAASLFYLSSVEEYREMIGETPEAIPALIGLLTSGSPRGQKNALVALYGLLLYHGIHQRVLATGIVAYLVKLLPTERSDLLDEALGVLAALAEKPEGAVEILQASALPLLVNHLQPSTSQAGNEQCLSILLSLCIHGGSEVVSGLRNMPSIMASLYSLLTSGTPRATKKARSLLSILHEWSNPGSLITLCTPVQQDRAMHAQ